MRIGTPLQPTACKVLLLGSGELGKELALEFARLGVEVVACDRYANAPAMLVAPRHYVFDMLDPIKLREVVLGERPHFIVPEIEAIATDELLRLQNEGFKVVPTASATRLTMNREGIRRLAAEELNLPVPRYRFADSFAELEDAVKALGYPCVVKPIMSSSGKGQSVIRSHAEMAHAWEYSQAGGRAGAGRVIVEEFIAFESEITLLTLRSAAGTVFCDPIGHKQVGGDYVESWQPHPLSQTQRAQAQQIALRVSDRLGGRGIFGVELFLLADGRVLFSEVSPRPHDTGMVTLITQDWSEFALHARAVLGVPVATITRNCAGASVALRAAETLSQPVYFGLDQAFAVPGVDVRIFGKPHAVKNRRMGVVLGRGETVDEALLRARQAHAKIILKDAMKM